MKTVVYYYLLWIVYDISEAISGQTRQSPGPLVRALARSPDQLPVCQILCLLVRFIVRLSDPLTACQSPCAIIRAITRLSDPLSAHQIPCPLVRSFACSSDSCPARQISCSRGSCCNLSVSCCNLRPTASRVSTARLGQLALRGGMMELCEELLAD